MKSKKNSEKGFSLIEVVVATSLMAIVSLGFSQMILNQRRSVSFLEDKLTKLSFESEIRPQVIKSCLLSLLNKTLDYNPLNQETIPSFVDNLGNPIVTSNTESGRLSIEQMYYKNKTITGPSTSGLITVVIPVSRTQGEGLKDFRPIEVDLNASVNSSNLITACGPPTTSSFDPSGLGRDGWMCSCNGDFSTDTEGGSTVCLYQEAGQITDVWVAPDPWTKATGGNFRCAHGANPNPPGSAPLLKWRYHNPGIYERCNMNAGDTVPTVSCP